MKSNYNFILKLELDNTFKEAKDISHFLSIQYVPANLPT